MNQTIAQIRDMVGGYVPTLLAAIAILVVGWLIALAAAAATRGLLGRTRLDERLITLLQGEDGEKAKHARRLASKIVYYLVMLFVLVAFLQTLGLTLTIEPLNRLLNQVFAFVPQIVAAALLLLVGWIVASLLRLLVVKSLRAMQVDERLGSRAGLAEEQGVPLTRTLGDVIYWFVLLLFLPMILDALQLAGLLEPVQALLDKVLGYLPNAITAGLIVLVGWFAARIAQRVVTNVLIAVGTDRLSTRVGVASALGRQNLSGTIGLIVYVLILLPVIIAALNALALEAVSQPASRMLEMILRAFPMIIAALLVVGIAYVVARVVSGLIANVLASAGFDRLFVKMGLRVSEDSRSAPSAVVRYLIIVTIMLFASVEAFAVMGFEDISDLLAQLVVFGAHVLLGLVILGVGLYLSKVASEAVRASGVGQAGILAVTARVAILSLAVAMALARMGLATEIIQLAFGLLLGAVAVAGAIAFGLGGKDAATRFLDRRGIKGP